MFSRQAAGEYVATLTAGTKPESLLITPSARNSQFAAANVVLVADTATAQIAEGSLVVLKNNAKADGKETNSVKATVTDASGNLLRDQTVSFKVDNDAKIEAEGKTGSDGSVTMTLTSQKAGQSTVTATVNGNQRQQVVTFVGDSATAQLVSCALVAVKDNAKADGTATNSVKATVTDAQGNILVGQKVSFSADNGASITASGTTGSDGSVTVTLTSTKAGQSNVSASTNGSSQSQTVSFVADSSTAQIVSGSLVVVKNGAEANGKETNSVKAMVTDAYGNILAGQTVNFTADNAASIATSGTTAADGSITMTLTSTKTGNSTVKASTGSSSASVVVNFSPDSSKLKIALTVVKDSAASDGSATNSVRVTVTDETGSALANQAVKLSADNGARIVSSGTTAADGTFTATLTNSTVGNVNVTASIGNNSVSVAVSFVTKPYTLNVATAEFTTVPLSGGTGSHQYC